MTVTQHGIARIRERIRVPKRAAVRISRRALEEGRPREQYSGKLRAYLDEQWADREGVELIVHREFVFVYGRDGLLITCWPLPKVFRRKRR